MVSAPIIIWTLATWTSGGTSLDRCGIGYRCEGHSDVEKVDISKAGYL
jgi:hypothetical protein